jgi:hypothetical protein
VSPIQVTSVRFGAPRKLALLLGLVATLALLWSKGVWQPGDEGDAGLTHRSNPSGVQASAATVAGDAPTVANQIVARLMRDQQEASEVVAAAVSRATDAMAPLTGPVRERPAYVSRMEWSMLNGVAQQHLAPERELTRLVNFLRFTKKLEIYESLPAVQAAAKRMGLAEQLLAELPERVRQGEMDLNEADRLLSLMLPDAVPDVQARAQRAVDEKGKLAIAVKAAQASVRL